MADIAKISRRVFLLSAGLAGAGVGGLYVTGKLTAVQNMVYGALSQSAKPLELFVRIGTDNRITLVSHRSEMGQGIKTGLPLVLADELEADWARVDVVQAPGHPDYGDQNTDSSQSVRLFYQSMREMGASVRLMLEQAAAQRWGVPVAECRARFHQVEHPSSGRRLSFGELAEAAAQLPVPARHQLQLKPKADFRYIGKSTPIVDLQPMVSGAAQYASDMVLPGMLFAVVEHAPVIGAVLEACDDQQARAVPGVVDVVVLPPLRFPVGIQPLHGVAVLAEHSWAALKARGLLKCRWSTGKYSQRSSEAQRQRLRERVATPGQLLRKNGDVQQAFQDAAQVHEATYTAPYLAHVPMEPPVAVADTGWNHCRIWASSQNPQNVRNEIAHYLNLPYHNVEVNVPLLGGGFGRKSMGDFCVQAAWLSARAGRPVKLFWSREDDVRNDYYHPISAQYFKAAIDRDNRVTGWLQRAAYPSNQSTFDSAVVQPSAGELSSGGFTSNLYAVASLQAEVHPAEEAVRIGWLRSVTSIHHAFAINGFADELAVIRQLDPVTNLRQLIGPARIVDPAYLQVDYPAQQQHPIDTGRLLGVLDRVVEASGFQSLDPGQGWGLAVHFSFMSYCAVATRLSVQDRQVQVEEVHVVLDCGQYVNEDRVRAQLEGAVVFGLSLALMGEITVENGAVKQSNFHDYPILRIKQTPRILTHLVESDAAPAGVGEPGVPPVAPSVTNAIFAATGERIRDLPLSRHFSV